MTVVDIFYYAMEDKSAIVNFLLEQHYIKENEELARLLSEANRQLASKDQEIENLQDAVVMLQSEISTLENHDRVLVDRNGQQATFRRNEHGIYEEIEEEPIREVRRRLNFDWVDEVDERELMDRLMFGTP
jgi:predicted  nucleic acid-binding Zn-ribbon protein